MLRIAGSYRAGRAIKAGRVRLALKDVIHARLAGSRVDLWLRAGDDASASLQRLALDLFSDDSARDLLHWLPDAKPWPHGQALAAPADRQITTGRPLLWAAVIGMALVAALLLWLPLRRWS